MNVEGVTQPGFEPVRDAFATVLAAQAGTGAAVAAWYDGGWVVDLWGGRADPDGVPWGRDTIVQPYSVTKPVAALCVLLLVDRGRIDLDAPMQRYWPELSAPTSVREVLSHQAGLVALDEPVPTEVFYDWDRMCALLAAQQPSWPPGTRHGESALFYGHLVGELVRRVDGRSLGQFLREEVCGPIGLDFAIGLSPDEQRRAATLTGLDDRFRKDNLAGRPELYQKAIANPRGAHDPDVVNSPAWRAAEIPAINGHGTARAVAGLYAELMAGRLLSPDLLREATSAQCQGEDAVIGADNAWGLGFGVDPDGFGMGGLGGSVGWASTAGSYAFAFLTGSMGNHDRADTVENALRSCLGLPPL